MQENTESHPFKFSTVVKEVTVYTDRAMVTRLANTQLSVGNHTIYLDDLPDALNEDSVRVNGFGSANVIIEDFKIHRIHYREVPESRIRTLMDEKEKLKKQRKVHEAEILVIEDQKAFLKEIRVSTTDSISQSFERRKPEIKDWRDVLNFLGEEANRLNLQATEIEDKIEFIDEEVRLIDESLNQVESLQKKIRNQIQVKVKVQEAGDFNFSIGYLIHNAFWHPMYDARVDTAEKKVILRCYGTVVQKTGENWENVRVILSTARPHISGNAPELYKWALFVRSEHHGLMKSGEPMAEKSGSPPSSIQKGMRIQEQEKFGDVIKEEAAMAQTQVISSDGASVLFTTSGRSDIPGNGSKTKLLFLEGEFPSKLQYLTIPKLSENVYLSAEIKNNTEYPLLPAPLNIFLDNNYMGRSFIKELVTPNEKFELSLGVDEAIKVRRKLMRKFGDQKGLFTKSKTEEFAYQIELNNQRDGEIWVIVQDQVPVSENDDINVKLDTISPQENIEKKDGELPEGTLEWRIQLKPKTKRKIEFSFTVSYGKDVDVQGL